MAVLQAVDIKFAINGSGDRVVLGAGAFSTVRTPCLDNTLFEPTWCAADVADGHYACADNLSERVQSEAVKSAQSAGALLDEVCTSQCFGMQT